MDRRAVARALRAIRRRKRWSQRRIGSVVGVSQAEISRRERSGLESCSVADVERWATALGAYLVLDIRVDGERPLSDARHAALQEWMLRTLRRAGWLAEPELSFNHYGDRGRIDVMAVHPMLEVLIVVEVKTVLTDVQDVLGRLDVKRRVARKLAGDRGWRHSSAIPIIVFLEASTTRRRIAAHEALFAGFSLRGRACLAWLKRPRHPAPGGLLMIVNMPKTTSR
jgi:transcriptional regulator with XRE-family HTH domain